MEKKRTLRPAVAVSLAVFVLVSVLDALYYFVVGYLELPVAGYGSYACMIFALIVYPVIAFLVCAVFTAYRPLKLGLPLMLFGFLAEWLSLGMYYIFGTWTMWLPLAGFVLGLTVFACLRLDKKDTRRKSAPTE